MSSLVLVMAFVAAAAAATCPDLPSYRRCASDESHPPRRGQILAKHVPQSFPSRTASTLAAHVHRGRGGMRRNRKTASRDIMRSTGNHQTKLTFPPTPPLRRSHHQPHIRPALSPQVVSSFEPAMLKGMWYEQAYIDIAQAGASCQVPPPCPPRALRVPVPMSACNRNHHW